MPAKTKKSAKATKTSKAASSAKRPRGRPAGQQHDEIIFFRCEKAMHKRLKALAAADDRPISQYIRQLIKKHFAEVDRVQEMKSQQAL